MTQFEIPQNLNPMENIIKVIGVGGGGSNAVKYLYNLNVKNVDFIVCNTDQQHLLSSPIPNKIQLGKNLTKGLGAGCIPERGREAAIESKEEIKRLLESNTEMVFIAAGLGGGTGTGAAPIIAEVARSLNILTVAIVTLPFKFEGKKKMEYAEKGLEELKKHVDSIIIIPNEKLKEIYPGMKMSEAFAKADDIVSTAAKSIAEIITNNLHINVDFNDVRTVMQNSGTALMGTAIARGENRALEALKNAINHPLLMNNSIQGARHILISITTGSDDISTDEFEAITDYITEASGGTADVIPGYGTDASLGDAVSITIVATGFQHQSISKSNTEVKLPFTNVMSVENFHTSDTSSEKTTSGNELNTVVNPTSETNTSSEQFIIETTSVQPVDTTHSDEQPSITEQSNEEVNRETTPQIFSEQEQTNITSDNQEENVVTPLVLPEDTETSPIAKIIEKQPSDEIQTISGNTSLENLSENIKKLSAKTTNIRQQLMNLNDPLVYQELEEKPAYLRKKETNTDEQTSKQNTHLKDHSNFNIDENGNIKTNPYLDDTVD